MNKIKKLNEEIIKSEERLSEIVKEKNDIVEDLSEYKSKAVKSINRLTEEQITINNKVAKARRQFNILSQPRQKVSSSDRNFYTSEQKAELIKKRGNKCEECDETQALTLHHKKKLSHGGKNEDSNIKVLCVECHQKQHRV